MMPNGAYAYNKIQERPKICVAFKMVVPHEGEILFRSEYGELNVFQCNAAVEKQSIQWRNTQLLSSG
jgi:hypothetical protein